MRKPILLSFAAALVAVGFVGPASAGNGEGYGWGACDGHRTLSVENETLDQSVAETDGQQSTKPAD